MYVTVNSYNGPQSASSETINRIEAEQLIGAGTSRLAMQQPAQLVHNTARSPDVTCGTGAYHAVVLAARLEIKRPEKRAQRVYAICRHLEAF